MNLQQLQDILRQTGWPDTVVSSRSGQVPIIALMASIGLAESSGNPNAHNPRGEDSVGLWQINRRAHSGHSVAQLKDPYYNARVALQVYRKQGLRAWGAYTDGGYLGRGKFSQSLALYSNGQSSASPIVFNNHPAVYPDEPSAWAVFAQNLGWPDTSAWSIDANPDEVSPFSDDGVVPQTSNRGIGIFVGVFMAVFVVGYLISE